MITTATVGRRRGITPSLHQSIIAEGYCHYCRGFTPDVLEVDHLIPWSRGGSDDVENLVPACWRCNQEKSDRTPAEWQQWRESRGKPWPVPSLEATLRALIDRLPAALIENYRPDEQINRAAHAAAVRGREAGFDLDGETDRLAGLLRTTKSGASR